MRIGNAHYQCSCVSYTTSQISISLIVGVSVGVAVLLVVIIIILIIVVVVVCRRLRSSQAKESSKVSHEMDDYQKCSHAIYPGTRECTGEYEIIDPAGLYECPTEL